MSDDITQEQVGQDVREALDIARKLVRSGVPLFVAPPCAPGCGIDSHPANKPHFKLPGKWQTARPTEGVIDRWQPGWALAAVGGGGADFLDIDPRNGGDTTAERLRADGDWPRTFGRQTTPSGGCHEIITPTGQGTRHIGGVDLVSGTPDGGNRGFVYIAPTVAPSKVTGELVPYRWVDTPDMDTLGHWTGHDDRVDRFVARVQAARGERVPRQRDTDDPFYSASGRAERTFTDEQAKAFLRPVLRDLQAAPIGEIEHRANVAAVALSHFVPGFWSADAAYRILTDALAYTAYDPTHPASTWQAAKFRPVLDGTRETQDPWIAVRIADPGTPTVPVSPGEEGLSTVERLRRMLVSADELAERPAPEPLVYGLLDRSSAAWLIGAPGSLKSFIALDIAAHVGAGTDWQGHRVHQGPVLYLAAEGEGGMVLRTRAYRKEFGGMPGVTFLPYPVQVKSGDGQWPALVEISRELSPVLIVIDTQHRVSVGLEENSATDMGLLVSAVDTLKRATGACILVVHHTGRNGQDARGSSALDGAQDTELKVIRGTPRTSLMCKIVQDKQKDMAEGDAIGIQLRLKVIDLGTDPVTGRDLSSLVVCGQDDPFFDAQGVDMVDVEPWRGRDPEPWTAKLVPAQAKIKRRILQVLADHAGMTGITEATARRVVTDRWEKVSHTGWADAWQCVKDLDETIRVSGERWILDMVATEAIRLAG